MRARFRFKGSCIREFYACVYAVKSNSKLQMAPAALRLRLLTIINSDVLK